MPPPIQPQRIRLRLRDYWYQYCQPQQVSAHRLWVDDYEIEASTVSPSSAYVPVLYYLVTFTDLSTATLHKDHGVTVEILPGRVTNR